MSGKDYDHTGCEYKNGFVRVCQTCGYEWEHGRNGIHSCISQLKQQLSEAKDALDSARSDLAKEVSCMSYYLQRAYDKARQEAAMDFRDYMLENWLGETWIVKEIEKYFKLEG